jgi:MerR family transcriptional regulator, thiopeptide resistance regulator
MRNQGWKVGELAKRVGLTVRTLHHYDQIGLFSPTRITESGHRLYTDEDMRVLQQILTLKQLGFSLEEIKRLITNPDFDPMEVLHMQLSKLQQQIDTLAELKERVQQIHDHLRLGTTATSEQFMMAMRLMNMTQSPHFNPEQVELLRSRYLSMGSDETINGYATGRQLLDEFRAYLGQGKLPIDPDVLALARRWKDETETYLQIDEPFIQSAERYYKENPDQGLIYGMDGELYAFIKHAVSLV